MDSRLVHDGSSPESHARGLVARTQGRNLGEFDTPLRSRIRAHFESVAGPEGSEHDLLADIHRYLLM